MEPEILYRFAKYYLDIEREDTHFNLQRSAEVAGITIQEAKELLSHPTMIGLIDEYKHKIKEIREKALDRCGITQDWILVQAKEILERCMEAKQPVDKKGNVLPFSQFDASNAISVLNLLKDFTGGFDKNTAHGSGKPIPLGVMAPDDYKKLRDSSESARAYQALLGNS